LRQIEEQPRLLRADALRQVLAEAVVLGVLAEADAAQKRQVRRIRGDWREARLRLLLGARPDDDPLRLARYVERELLMGGFLHRGELGLELLAVERIADAVIPVGPEP